MNTDKLAPVFLDNKAVNLQDAKPKLSAILSAGGKSEVTEVKWLQFQPNTQGKTVRAEEILDRTSDPSKPIYLTSGGGHASGAGQSGVGGKSYTAGQSSTVGQQFQNRGGDSSQARQPGSSGSHAATSASSATSAVAAKKPEQAKVSADADESDDMDKKVVPSEDNEDASDESDDSDEGEDKPAQE